MLDFFRKYQRFFFIIISVVIIISFSFFGTYSTLNTPGEREQIAFTAINGTAIKRHDLDEMAIFLGTDATDKMLFGGVWGPNFLNDGVVKRDILELGLGTILASQYSTIIKPDLASRLEKEKYDELYTNPHAKFIGVESAWTYFAPEMKASYQGLKHASDPTTPEAFNQRVYLYLGQQQIHPGILKQILRYQEKQNQWIQPDANLDRQDLFVFGYRTAEDWFGPRFIRLICELVINGSIIAEQKGYAVSKDEALADLMRNASLSFQQNQRNPYLGVTNSTEYFNEQLRLLNIDQAAAVKIWRQVMLFRRFFGDIGNSVVVDPFAFEQFRGYTGEVVTGTEYHLPKALQIGTPRDLQKFELYLSAISKRPEKGEELLDLPKSFYSVSDVQKKYPELVQRRYLLEIAEVKKTALESKVGLKETWNWEVENNNWDSLKKQFPDLGVKNANTREERFAALDQLDQKTRLKIDKFARKEIVNAHPESMKEALEEAQEKVETIGMGTKGGSVFFKGVSKRKDLITLLDQASLPGQAENQASEKLHQFTGDQETYYRIRVLDRANDSEILTFAEANQEGILDGLLERELEAYYVKIRTASPELFQKEDKSWKTFADIRDIVGEKYMDPTAKAIQQDYAAAISPEKAPAVFLADFTASLRFYKYMRNAEAELKKNQNLIASSSSEENSKQKLAARQSLGDQWKLEKESTRQEKSQLGESKNDLFTLAENDWSSVYTPANGNVHFIHLLKKEAGGVEVTAEKMTLLHRLIAAEAQRHYMRSLVKELKDKNALSLNYMEPSGPSMSVDTTDTTN